MAATAGYGDGADRQPRVEAHLARQLGRFRIQAERPCGALFEFLFGLMERVESRHGFFDRSGQSLVPAHPGRRLIHSQRHGPSRGGLRDVSGEGRVKPLDVMDRDARKMRGARPFLFTNLKDNIGVTEIASFLTRQGGLEAGSAE